MRRTKEKVADYLRKRGPASVAWGALGLLLALWLVFEACFTAGAEEWNIPWAFVLMTLYVCAECEMLHRRIRKLNRLSHGSVPKE